VSTLELINVVIGYDKPLSQELNLQINRGLVLVLGPNGCGKTTLLRTIAGLVRPLKGSIKIMGEDVTGNPKKAGRYVGYMPQLSYFKTFFNVTVLEYVESGLILKAGGFSIRSPETVKKLVHDILEAVGVPQEYWDRSLWKLSGGMKQRVLLARAIIGNPIVLLLDEPLSAIDPSGREPLANLIMKFAEDRVVIVTSHDPTLFMKGAALVVLLGCGYAYIGSPEMLDDEELLKKVYGASVKLIEKHLHIVDYH